MKMEIEGYSISELIRIYSQTIKELKRRGVLRTKNVIGELGEYLVLEYYDRNPNLPNLTTVPVGTKNINAISQNGERYSIKSTSGHVTGVFYGLEPLGSTIVDKPLFEYVIICKLNDDCELEGIYQLSWDAFQKHKKWHSRMKAWNIAVTKTMKEDSIVIYEKEEITPIYDVDGEIEELLTTANEDDNIEDTEPTVAITWNKTGKINHNAIRDAVTERLQKILKHNYGKTSQSRYVTKDKDAVLFVLSASYSQKNREYWYSINDEIIPWLELFPVCHVAFALGSAEHVLLFSFAELINMLNGCLRSKEDLEIGKKAHYHFSFAVEGPRVYFKKKIPEKEFIEVTDKLV